MRLVKTARLLFAKRTCSSASAIASSVKVFQVFYTRAACLYKGGGRRGCPNNPLSIYNLECDLQKMVNIINRGRWWPGVNARDSPGRCKPNIVTPCAVLLVKLPGSPFIIVGHVRLMPFFILSTIQIYSCGEDNKTIGLFSLSV